jgi:D-alanyl-D-alanine carboxypeptidase (penicillin-binding protein 5/6)
MLAPHMTTYRSSTVPAVSAICASTCLALSLLAATTAARAAVTAPPQLDNKAYVLMDYDSGQILAQFNAEQPLPPASLTKMMTSYIVEQSLKSGKLKTTDQVHVSQNAWCRGSSTESCMYLPLNSQASVIDILRGIIVQSGNDASKAIAEHISGSEAAFAQLMNEQATRLGMTHTHFVNPTGLPDPSHKASAHDLALLARAIIRDSADYYPIYAEREFKYNGIKQGNRNALLYTDPTVDGLKTGHTEEAGFCLTASSKRNGMRLISVLMGTNSMQARADQTRVLFNWGFSAFEKATLAQGGVAQATANVQFGKVDIVRAGLTGNWSLLVPRGEASKVSLTVQLNPQVTAPIKQGAPLGKLVATLDGKPYAEQPLVALEAVEEAGFLKRTWQRLRGLIK